MRRHLLAAAASATFGLAAGGAAVVGAPATAAAEGATESGWWSSDQAATAVLPPGVPVVVPALPTPGSVPEGAIAVGATAGTPDKVAAVGFSVPTGPGGTVSTLTLTLSETGDASVNRNAITAAIEACPITHYWVGTSNGEMEGAPACMDAVVAPGSRAPDGTWTFDLRQLAAVWTSPDDPLDQHGVRLQPRPGDGSGTFQVAFDPASAVVEFDGTAGAGTGGDDPGFADEPSDPGPEPVPVDSPRAGSALPSASPATTAPAGAPPARPAPSRPGPPAPLAGAGRAGQLLGNLPPLAVLVVVGTAGLLLLVSLVLGTQPATGGPGRRQGPLSRALARKMET